MREKTLSRCLEILDIQKACIKSEGEQQEAYYLGLRAMLETVVSGNYTNKKLILFNEFTNTHYIQEF